MKSKNWISGSLAVTVFLATGLAVPQQGPAAAEDVAISQALPKGVIVMWSGKADEIPAGWSLCDGNNGTPDLRDRFVMGVGTREYANARGGTFEHDHRTHGHSHRVSPPSSHISTLASAYGGRGKPGYYGGGVRMRRYYSGTRAFQSQTAPVKIDRARHLPPYFRLAFIMKN